MSLPSTPEILKNWPTGRPNRRTLFDPSEDPWLLIAQRVLKGHYDNKGADMKRAIIMGLRNIHRGGAQEAVRHLKRKKGKDEHEE